MLIPESIQAICNKLSQVTYENLTKILRFHQSGSADVAQRLDDAFQNDLDHWMGGGTCFSITWHLYHELRALGFTPRILMGHKRKERNIHCGLLLELESESALEKAMLFFDPGYLIFDPLSIPHPLAEAQFALMPNMVQLRRPAVDHLQLWTGSPNQALKLRFDFPLQGVDEQEFFAHWKASFHFDMMTYPVLNRLDRERGIQYYYQKGNLLTRDAQGSRMQAIAPQNRVQVLSEIFRLDPALIENVLKRLAY